MIGRSYFLAPATGLLFTHSAKQRKSSALGAELLNGDIEGEGLGGSRRRRKQRDRPRGVPLPAPIFLFFVFSESSLKRPGLFSNVEIFGKPNAPEWPPDNERWPLP